MINRHQHEFLSYKSTTTQLLECCLDWNIAPNARSNIDIIHLDFSKTFDSVVHAKSIAKLARYGVNDMLLYWIQSFLTDRFQYVKIGNSFSALHSVVSGVVQGSVLGPILFVLSVNDICDLASLGVTIKSFADDTKPKLYYVFNNAMSPESLVLFVSYICLVRPLAT